MRYLAFGFRGEIVYNSVRKYLVEKSTTIILNLLKEIVFLLIKGGFVIT